jgi:hypothetical protein
MVRASYRFSWIDKETRRQLSVILTSLHYMVGGLVYAPGGIDGPARAARLVEDGALGRSPHGWARGLAPAVSMINVRCRG